MGRRHADNAERIALGIRIIVRQFSRRERPTAINRHSGFRQSLVNRYRRIVEVRTGHIADLCIVQLGLQDRTAVRRRQPRSVSRINGCFNIAGRRRLGNNRRLRQRRQIGNRIKRVRILNSFRSRLQVGHAGKNDPCNITSRRRNSSLVTRYRQNKSRRSIDQTRKAFNRIRKFLIHSQGINPMGNRPKDR